MSLSMATSPCQGGIHKVNRHSLQGADYSLQLRGKLQTARLAGHQPQANPFGLQTFNKRKNGSCPGPCVTTSSDCLRPRLINIQQWSTSERSSQYISPCPCMTTTSVRSRGKTDKHSTRANMKSLHNIQRARLFVLRAQLVNIQQRSIRKSSAYYTKVQR